MVKIFQQSKRVLMVSIIALFTSCGESPERSVDDIIAQGDLTIIREKRNALLAEQQAKGEQLLLLDTAIAELSKEQYLALITTQKIEPTLFKEVWQLDKMWSYFQKCRVTSSKYLFRKVSV